MKSVLFDFDGVIVDSFELSYRCVGIVNPNPPTKEEYRRYFDGNIFKSTEVNRQKKKFEVSEDDPFNVEYVLGLLELDPVDGMSEVLRTLNVDYRSAIISSSINNPIKKYLNKFQLDGIFEEIYGAEFSLSKEVKIKVALEKFQITGDEAVFITDTLGDMREAAKVGVKSIGVTWGFQKESNLKKGNPVAIVNTPEELLATIESLG